MLQQILYGVLYSLVLIISSVLLIGVPFVFFEVLKPTFKSGEVLILLTMVSCWGAGLKGIIYLIHKSSRGLIYGKETENKET